MSIISIHADFLFDSCFTYSLAVSNIGTCDLWGIGKGGKKEKGKEVCEILGVEVNVYLWSSPDPNHLTIPRISTNTTTDPSFTSVQFYGNSTPKCTWMKQTPMFKIKWLKKNLWKHIYFKCRDIYIFYYYCVSHIFILTLPPPLFFFNCPLPFYIEYIISIMHRIQSFLNLRCCCHSIKYSTSFLLFIRIKTFFFLWKYDIY